MTFRSTIHTERILVFPLQEWLGERSTMLPYTYVASLVWGFFKDTFCASVWGFFKDTFCASVWGFFKNTFCASQMPQSIDDHKIYILNPCDSTSMCCSVFGMKFILVFMCSEPSMGLPLELCMRRHGPILTIFYKFQSAKLPF